MQFGFTLVFGLLIHMYVMVNSFINHDSVAVMADNRWAYLYNGRWFGIVPDVLSTNFNLMWVNSLLSILYISLAVALIGACLGIKRTLMSLVLSVIVVSFPTVACGLSYRLDSDVHFLAVLLACLAAWLVLRYRFGFIAAAVVLVLSLATYQAYVGFFAGIAVLALIRDLLSGGKMTDALLKAAKFLVTLGVGVSVYLVSVRLAYSGGGYKGVGTLSGLTLQTLPKRIGFAYQNIFDIFFRNSLAIHRGYFASKYVFVLAALLVLVLLVVTILSRRVFVDLPRLICLVVLIVLVPPTTNVVAILSPDYLYLLMQYSLVLLFVLALVLVDVAEQAVEESPVTAHLLVSHIVSWVTVAFCCLAAFNYTLYSNVFYSKMDLVNSQGRAFSTTLVTRLQSEDYYTVDKPIVLYGTTPRSFALGYYNNFFAIPIEDIPSMYSYPAYLLTYLDLKNPLYSKDSLPPELGNDAAALTSISSLPDYPNAGSIVQVDGVIVVKFSS
ncbi:MAG: glucosyltransferase domain-containing protein [Propionibacteriaceae bacterium]|nr:glucosyltransferase domain-containing protein [Propionibacteriaceae bacterium]